MSKRSRKHNRHPQPSNTPVPANPAQTTVSQSQAIFEVRQQSWSGPLPPPLILRGYEELVPGAADRILHLTEEQSKHRQGLETKVINGNVKAQALGQHYAFTLCFLLFGGGIYLLANGRDVGGLASLVLATLGVVGTFIATRAKQDKERAEKREQIPRPR